MHALPHPDKGREFLQKEKMSPSCLLPLLRAHNGSGLWYKNQARAGAQELRSLLCSSLLPVLPTLSVGRTDRVLVSSPSFLGGEVQALPSAQCGSRPKGGPLAEMAVSPESLPSTLGIHLHACPALVTDGVHELRP